ncbi:MAG: inorganic diphosphatase [Solirubrobacteraceae bacterium]|nr:inorganic diphosphatase [Solirubrobacteraceae bacterium]
MASDLFAYVEIPKGSRNKYEYDAEVGALVLDRFLFSSVVYPSDYGFIPDTLGEDGDPLDALVIVTEPTFPGCTIPVKAIGIFKMTDDKGKDDKIVCIPTTDPNWTDVNDLSDLNGQLKTEISHFFEIYKQPEGKTVTIDGWDDREAALAEIEASRKRWADSGAKPIPFRG